MAGAGVKRAASDDGGAHDHPLKRVTGTIHQPEIGDDHYLPWIAETYPLLAAHVDSLASARDKYLELRKQALSVDKLSEATTADYIWPTHVPKPSTEGELERFFGPTPDEFNMMGRSYVREIVDFLRTSKRVFLYGPQGVGKSHILAAVALYYTTERTQHGATATPVCYIPDMKGALTTNYLFDCIVQAFIDWPDKLAQAAECPYNVAALAKWLLDTVTN